MLSQSVGVGAGDKQFPYRPLTVQMHGYRAEKIRTLTGSLNPESIGNITSHPCLNHMGRFVYCSVDFEIEHKLVVEKFNSKT